MPGQKVLMGPFIGGMNTLSDPAAIAENELVDILNMDVDIDGSLVSRPPVALSGTNGAFDSNVTAIGVAYFSGAPYVLGSSPNGIWYYASGAWNLITTGLKSYAAVQWLDKVFFLSTPGSSKTSGWWVPSAPTTLNAIATMPYGYTMVLHKNQLFTSTGILDVGTTASRVSFSAIGDGLTWSGGSAGQFDVNLGDGQAITRLTVHNNELTIFKRESVHVFSFSDDLASGTLRRISNVIGATNTFAVASYENDTYVYHRSNVYHLVNFVFVLINARVPFALDTSGPGTYEIPIFLQIINDKVMLRYYNNIYSYNLRTKTWSRYQSTRYFGPLLVISKDYTGLNYNSFVGGSCIVGSKEYYSFNGIVDGSTTETFTCSILSKNYDVGESSKFKRLFWWGADMGCVNSLTGTVTPIVYSFAPTWGDVAGRLWNTLGLWGNPLLALTGTTSTVVPGLNPTAKRRFFKFPKSLRFRQANFTLSTTTDGTTGTGPVRIFLITALISRRETVAQQVN